MKQSFAESTARKRVSLLLDCGTFEEILGPAERMISPHLEQLDVPAAFDDGVVIGRGKLDGRSVLIAAQEGGFLGGGVGEVHGAKLVGLLKLALTSHPDMVIILAESGGVRLHEANAGLIAVSEVMRAVFEVRNARIPVVMLIGGSNGCFGGMGLVARCGDRVVMSDVGRLSMSGPEVIESTYGVEEFDSRDRALVWRTTGGRHRYLMGDCDALIDDDIAAFRVEAVAAMGTGQPLTPDDLEAEHALLKSRIQRFGGCRDAVDVWTELGILDAERVVDLDVDALLPLGPN